MCFDDFFQKGSRCIIIGIIIENLSLAVKAAIDIFKWTKINHIASPSGIECVPERCKDAAGKQTKQRSSEVIEYESQCQSCTKPHTKPDADTLFHAVVFSGTKILSYESRNGDTERIIDHPV